MSIQTPERLADAPVEDAIAEEALLKPEPEEAVPSPPPEPEEEVLEEGEQPVNVLLTSVAIFLSVAAAGWMCSGIFRGEFAKLVAMLGAALGVGMVGFSYRTRRPSIIQYLALPAAVVMGAILVLPDARGGSANLPGLVAEAVRTGGLTQPPIPFDPGWRFILVLLIAVLGAAAASLATGLNKPKVGIFMPVPLLFGAALLQPKEETLVSIGVALVFFIASLAVSYGVELAKEGATSGQFEVRRLVRGLGVLVLLIGVLAGLSQFGFLFPEPAREQVIPPTKPEPQPPQADRVLFSVNAPRSIPWRLGVLDVYDGEAWLLPPYDTARFKNIPPSGKIPPSLTDRPKTTAKPEATKPAAPGSEPSTLAVPRRETFTATFVINDMEGHVIPTIADAEKVRKTGFLMQFDPRTQMFRLPDKRASQGMTYSVEAEIPPSGVELAKAGDPGSALKSYLDMPPPPQDVQALLDQAPVTNLFDRLQFIRNAFYQTVVAAGAGQPVDVPPSRVADMLAGKEATPYEITAAEALLARWGGIPSRVGYGFYGGDKADPAATVFSIHPKHGSTWLEVYFEGFGWVPIVGVPPKAKASLSQQQKKEDPLVRPTEELALIVYVPIKRQSIQLLFVTVRYWVVRSVPALVGIFLIWALLPGVFKALRRFWRLRWAHGRGLTERIAVSYSEFRDVANDLNLGDPTATPLKFVTLVEPDEEHDEFAWLVTRALWGDLSRALRPDDAEAAEDLRRSVTRRLRKAQTLFTRVLAFGARASLRDPYFVEVPNLWPSWLARGALRKKLRKVFRPVSPIRRIRRLLPTSSLFGVILVLTVIISSACAREVKIGGGTSKVPERIVPQTIDRFTFQREEELEELFTKPGRESLVSEGRVYTIRSENDIHGYLEVAAFKRGVGANQREVREGVLDRLEVGKFETKRLGTERVQVAKGSEQTFLVWFPPNGRYFELLVARQGFEEAEGLFAAVLAFQRGEERIVIEKGRGDLVDPRRGGDL